MKSAVAITLTDEQRAELKRRARSQTMDARTVRRARIVLLAAEGIGNHEIARRLQISRNQVIEWRKRFAQGGIAAVSGDLPRSGRKSHIDAAHIVQMTTRPCPRMPPTGAHVPSPPSWGSPTPPCSRSGTPTGSSRT
ncbi:helix-turn-helix domain-containing protein [Dyella sp. KRB-257]|uniref:helix-turn-helix domain-containing protein n=1 Tax=Dyella sp. KRB-257 TaxID=3400915 RepID=UPI003C0516DE